MVLLVLLDLRIAHQYGANVSTNVVPKIPDVLAVPLRSTGEYDAVAVAAIARTFSGIVVVMALILAIDTVVPGIRFDCSCLLVPCARRSRL